MIDELWVVTVPPKVACERIQKRNSLSEEQALVRINAQLSNGEREAYADQLISYARSYC
jgi:dephospho-CoA kinase